VGAYAGAAGTLNLAQGNYIKDKAYGMGALIGRITSPLTGKSEPILDTGFLPRHTDANVARWRRWWRAANWEHLLTFLVLGVLSLVLLACIAHSTVFGLDIGEGMEFIQKQGVEIGKSFGALARAGFWVAGMLILLTTELGIMDIVARVSADIIRTCWARDSKPWTLRNLYYVWLWGEILVGCTILLMGLNAPIPLLVLGASLNGLVMALYVGAARLDEPARAAVLAAHGQGPPGGHGVGLRLLRLLCHDRRVRPHRLAVQVTRRGGAG